MLSGFLTTGIAYGQETEPDRSVESATLRFEFDNDVFFGKDNQISSAWALQKHSAVAQDWGALEELPGFVRQLGRRIPTLTKRGLHCRAGIAIGQVIQTPDDLSRSDLIEDDVPYAGALTIQATWYAYNHSEFRGFEITVGIVGPPSLAEQTQTVVHALIGADAPKGWGNQLSTEPVINLNYMRKKRLWRKGEQSGFSFDGAINGNVGLGNLFTQATASLELRMGHRMPGGFAYVPDPIGYSMHYNAALKVPAPRVMSLYGSLVLRGTAFAHNIFLDGNTFTESHSVDKEPFVGQIIVGLHFERPRWALRVYAFLSTDTVDTEKSPLAEGGESLGIIAIEWRW